MYWRLAPARRPRETSSSQTFTSRPSPIRRLINCTCGLSRKSSVPALKLRPSCAIFFLPVLSTISTARSTCSALLGMSDSSNGSLRSSSLALYAMARRSFGRQEPPKAKPGERYDGEIFSLVSEVKISCDRVRVDAKMLAHGPHLVGETNFHRVIAVGKILDHFGNRNGRLVQRAGRVFVKFAQRRKVVSVAGSENRIRRIQKVGDRAAFAHELRVIANRETLAALLAAFFFQNGEHDSFGGSRQYCAAQNKNVRRLFLADGGSDFPGHVLDVAEVEFAIFQAGCTYADERDFGIQHSRGGVGSRPKQPSAMRLGDHLAHASFDDRSAARIHHFNFGAAHVHANDFVAHRGNRGLLRDGRLRGEERRPDLRDLIRLRVPAPATAGAEEEHRGGERGEPASCARA